MIQFAEVFPGEPIVVSLIRELSFIKQFVQNEHFKRFVTDVVINLTAG